MIAALNRLVEFVEEHLAEEVDVAGLASELGTTEYHVRRMFSSLAGMPLSEYIRRRRMEKQFTLRDFARQVGVSPTYMSHVEQDMADPPTAERVRKMAELLDEYADELIAMAGRLPEDLSEIIQNRATEMPELLREASGLTPDQLQKVRDQIRKLKEKGDG